MIKLKKQIILASAIMIFIFTNPAQAVLGVGDIKFNPDLTIITAIKSIKDAVYQAYMQISRAIHDYESADFQSSALAQQLIQIQRAYTQIQNQISMMQGLDTSNIHKFFASLRELDNQMATINRRMDGMLESSSQVIDGFEKLYPNLQQMAGLTPEQSREVVNNSYQAQRDNIKNAKARSKAIYEQREVLNRIINEKTEANHSVEGLKGAAQMGNDIALQQMAQNQSIHETQGQILKQAVDNQNNMQMLSQAMQIEANTTFKYTPTPVTTEGTGIFHSR